jgi:hypothetical protein
MISIMQRSDGHATPAMLRIAPTRSQQAVICITGAFCQHNEHFRFAP